LFDDFNKKPNAIVLSGFDGKFSKEREHVMHLKIGIQASCFTIHTMIVYVTCMYFIIIVIMTDQP